MGDLRPCGGRGRVNPSGGRFGPSGAPLTAQTGTSQRAAIAVDFLTVPSAPACKVISRVGEKRMAEGGSKAAPGGPSEKGVSSDTPFRGGKNSRSCRKAGDMVGVGEATVARAKRVKVNDPERVRRGDLEPETRSQGPSGALSQRLFPGGSRGASMTSERGCNIRFRMGRCA